MKHGSDGVISNERAADERYRTSLRDEERNRVRVHHGRGGAGRVPSRDVLAPAPPRRGLLGRVELAEPTDFFDGTNFYIGSRPFDGDGMVVFSWAAPIAGTFFRGRGGHELCSQVTARRTLLRRGGLIHDYIDDDGPSTQAAEPFAARKLSIPRAPVRRPLPGRSVPEQRRREVVPGQERVESRPAASATPPEPELRAGRAVLAAITAPRQERLTSVLATLQPDQYDHVIADAETPLVIQGHPGTGKTVIAAHRAAFLVHRDNELRARRVLIVGPTQHYVRHIRGVLNDLVENSGTVDAMSLDAAMLDVRGLSEPLDDSQPMHFRDVDADLGQRAERAAHLLRDAGQIGLRRAHAAGVEDTYEALRRNKVGTYRISREREWIDYLRALPTFKTASAQRRYLPLLAACGAAVAGVGPYSYDHVIVDEAQDVTALEWAVLKEINPRGSWTLLGDMNQRRSDLSCHDWCQIADVLGGRALEVKTLKTGYRTTAAIMQFAARLLSKSERTLESLQAGGVAPQVKSARPADLYTRVSGEVAGLLGRHEDGTVAVIDTDPRNTMQALRRAGYTVEANDRHAMTRNSRRVRVLDPQEARGLEFDAVIVVEPSSFPTRLGRHGLLYTSLTRANRELVVVHSDPLPEALRTRPSQRPTTAQAHIPAQWKPAQPSPIPEFRTAAG